MTYCVGLLLKDGIVFASDSRTNAGVDNFSQFCKMTVFERPGDRVLVLLSSGALSGTQAIISVLKQRAEAADGQPNIWTARTMFDVASVVSDATREVERRDAAGGRNATLAFNASFIFGGQIAGEAPRLFRTYAETNFIEAEQDSPFLQTGETKYGKPILDRVITRSTSLSDATKCVLLSFDSTMRSNLSVGLPIDLLCYETGSLRVTRRRRLDQGDAYFGELRRAWSDGVREAFTRLPEPTWS
jgi:putative proteasome-type protease